MTESEIKNVIDRVLERDFEIDPSMLNPEASLFSDFELDSLDVVDLIVALEKAFSFKIRTEQAQGFRDVRTLRDLYSTVKKLHDKISGEPQKE